MGFGWCYLRIQEKFIQVQTVWRLKTLHLVGSVFLWNYHTMILRLQVQELVAQEVSNSFSWPKGAPFCSPRWKSPQQAGKRWKCDGAAQLGGSCMDTQSCHPSVAESLNCKLKWWWFVCLTHVMIDLGHTIHHAAHRHLPTHYNQYAGADRMGGARHGTNRLFGQLYP
jgi:hypothetical protein